MYIKHNALHIKKHLITVPASSLLLIILLLLPLLRQIDFILISK